eukprot:6961800-Pyramimonas_sp.AAC.2
MGFIKIFGRTVGKEKKTWDPSFCSENPSRNTHPIVTCVNFAESRSASWTGEDTSDVLITPHTFGESQTYKGPRRRLHYTSSNYLLVGSFEVQAGPLLTANPPAYTCQEACALVFGTSYTAYGGSVSGTSMTGTCYGLSLIHI